MKKAGVVLRTIPSAILLRLEGSKTGEKAILIQAITGLDFFTKTTCTITRQIKSWRNKLFPERMSCEEATKNTHEDTNFPAVQLWSQS
jgi:hypothetical protein